MTGTTARRLLAAYAVVALANIGLTTPLWLISVLLVFQGFGMGLHAAPATVAAMDTLPSELLGQGSAMRSLTSQVAGALSVATLSAVLSVATPTGASPSPRVTNRFTPYPTSGATTSSTRSRLSHTGSPWRSLKSQ